MDRWTQSPYTAAVLDFEYHSQFLNDLKDEAEFQVAIANALG